MSQSALTIEAFLDMEDLPGYTPQAISDILPIYHPEDSASHIRSYNLRQTSPSTQTLSLQEGASLTPLYEIKSHKTGGFMNRKPHVVITSSEEGRPVAEGRFDIHGTGTAISYPHGDTQRLELENSLAQVLRTRVHGSNLWWQPHPGNKGVLELTNEADEIVARFVYSLAALQRTGSWPDRVGSASSTRKNKQDHDMGELQVISSPEFDESAYDRILCSAIVVIERAKRRAANMAKTDQGPPCGGMAISQSGGFL